MHKSELNKNPIIQFSIWFEEAKKAQVYQPEAMTLATVSTAGKPSARIVLLKKFNENGFVFFTNYKSRKGTELLENPSAAVVFFWPELHRQVRIEGKIEKSSKEESNNYFLSRPRESQIGAWVSEQSKEIKDRSELENRYNKFRKEFKNSSVAYPPFWGGFRFIPESIEFWQARENRLHDRFLFKQENKIWKVTRLAP